MARVEALSPPFKQKSSWAGAVETEDSRFCGISHVQYLVSSCSKRSTKKSMRGRKIWQDTCKSVLLSWSGLSMSGRQDLPGRRASHGGLRLSHGPKPPIILTFSLS